MKKIVSIVLVSALFIPTVCLHAKEKPKTKPADEIKKTKSFPIVEVTTETFEKFIFTSKTPIFLDVYSEWCAPFLRMVPIFEQVSKLFENKKIIFAKIKINDFKDSDKHIKLLKDKLDASIKMVPTFLYIKDGKVVETIIGSQTASILKEKLVALMDPVQQKSALGTTQEKPVRFA